jgi:multimeric flavodoxin WrbA
MNELFYIHSVKRLYSVLKVTVFIGSERKKATYQAAVEFGKCLKTYDDVDIEYIFLCDYKLDFCRGCKLCFDKGEEFCPLSDDRDFLLEKMERSDGVVFATPNYGFQVSARMKCFIDRLCFVMHRPRFFGKAFTAIVTQGVFGGKDIQKYIESTGENLGFNVIRGSCVTTLEPMTEKQKQNMAREMKCASERFYKGLISKTAPAPALLRLLVFRLTRTCLKNAELKFRDYYYYREKGWLESDYYNVASLGPVKKLAGRLFDFMGRIMVKHI